MGRLVSKINMQKRLSGKENGALPLSPGKMLSDRIPVGNPGNQLGAQRRQDTRAFDRYPIQDYNVIEQHGGSPRVAAW